MRGNPTKTFKVLDVPCAATEYMKLDALFDTVLTAVLVWMEVLTVTDCDKCMHEEICDQVGRLLWSTMYGEETCSDYKNRSEYVKVRHGRWVKSNAGGFVCCTCCEDIFVNSDWLRHDTWNYCPNCGAKMDGGANDAAD